MDAISLKILDLIFPISEFTAISINDIIPRLNHLDLDKEKAIRLCIEYINLRPSLRFENLPHDILLVGMRRYERDSSAEEREEIDDKFILIKKDMEKYCHDIMIGYNSNIDNEEESISFIKNKLDNKLIESKDKLPSMSEKHYLKLCKIIKETKSNI